MCHSPGHGGLLQLLIHTLISAPQTLAQSAQCRLWLVQADRSIGLIMPFSSAQMKALCLRAEEQTLRFTLKAFCGTAGCVQRCGWGLYNLAALGNYKDKWREARSITHPVREGGLRLGNFVLSKPPQPPWLPTFSLSLTPATICTMFFSMRLLFLSISVSFPRLLSGTEVFIYTSSAAQIAPLPSLAAHCNLK